MSQQQRCQLLTGTFEPWFLQRSPLHLLVSIVRVWGPNEHVRSSMPPMLDAARVQLLNELCSSDRIGSGGLAALLDAHNANNATAFVSACHFGCEAAVKWLLGRQELTWQRMLRGTKRGEFFGRWDVAAAGWGAAP
jgi:hypothetical protein